MCGIFAYIGDKKNAGQLILEGLKSLEYRGYDSWGVAVRKNDGSVFIDKHTGKIGTSTLPEMLSTIGLGHTRWATHGGVTDENAHPHADCTNKIIVVHNGIVENFKQLKEELVQKNHIFLSETDTEVLAHLLEEYTSEGMPGKDAMLKLFGVIKGLNAVIAFFPDTEEIIAMKNGSPLVVGKSDHELLLSSDVSAIIPYTNNVYYLEDGEMVLLNRSSLTVYDIKGVVMHPQFHHLDLGIADISLGAFPTYMLKEMYEQPNILTHIAQRPQKEIDDLAQVIKQSYGTYFVGCGTASYACLGGTYLFSKIAKRHVNACIASEFSYQEDFIKKGSLVIALSQSGETIEVTDSIKKAKQKEATIMAITNVEHSTLARLADHKVLLNAGPEKAVASTKAYTSKIAILYRIASALNGSSEQAIQQLQKASSEVSRLCNESDTIHVLAKQMLDSDHIFVLGRGISYSAALESALKIKEVSYIHAEGFAGGELKHGVIALVQKRTPVIIFNPEDETYEDMLSSAHEVKARGGYIIGIADKPNPVYDTFIHVKDCKDITLIPQVVVAQLLGYFLAIEKGYDPDKPRNLAKSVTVK